MGGGRLLVEFVFERIVLLRILLVLRRIVVLRRRGVRFQLTRGSRYRADEGARRV
ncbi:hypothetical protein [Streptomyces sp. NPDC006463]|uniref:hypothetical protein n=1 Tax=Streptomyces sp. NPDC006463 TaxID=3364746 RepID=UPI003682AF9D